MSVKGKQLESKRREESFDLEQQFILRLPPGQAMALSHELETNSNLKDNLFIDISPDSRWGSVRYGGEVISAKLVDMPCTIETLKTTDQKTFYKTADISQMLICSNDLEPSDEESESPKKKKEKEKKYHYPHGIVPPLKNVRRRRFRKTLRKKPIDLASIEKEVKRLLRMDIEAIDVKYEEITEHGATVSNLEDEAGGGSGKKRRAGAVDASGSGEQLDVKLFGEISSSDDDADVNIDSESDSEQMSVPRLKGQDGGETEEPDEEDFDDSSSVRPVSQNQDSLL